MFETLAPYIIAGLLIVTGYVFARWAAAVDVAKHWKAITTNLADNIDGMREEGCAAQGVLQNIFNGVTAGGVPHSKLVKKVADVAADALLLCAPCDHKEAAEGLQSSYQQAEAELVAATLSIENLQYVANEAINRAEEAERLLGLANDRLTVERSKGRIL